MRQSGEMREAMGGSCHDARLGIFGLSRTRHRVHSLHGSRLTSSSSSSSSSFRESGRVDVIDSAVMSMDTDWLYRILY